ncbi:MAG TPA: L-aspartate oxidase [Candidatus Dormibacteraeota bacterium]|nr:L-aspartate oxidase [Candidatus Dormibacteraeota bacterium]
MQRDVLVIGSGAAGLLLALSCAEQGLTVALATKGSIEESNTAWAQGGVAAALDLEEDSPAAHLSDTLAAGAGLCDVEAAEVVAAEAPRRVEELRAMGVAFDATLAGALELTREAAHSHARVAHAADATGRAISHTLAGRVMAHPNVTLLERATAIELIVVAGACRGAWILVGDAPTPVLASRAVGLATGGSGRLFARTTNPPGATADGLALALAAGARLADVEFVQFHPTALALAGAPALLVSEAARGEGGIIVDGHGRRFCYESDPRGELAPRDVVARAIFRHLLRGEQALLDLRPIGPPERVRARFPNIAAACAGFGIDIGAQPIPVSPAAHYHMGGIRTDLWGRTGVERLFAVGECACTGLHGANRLASNSLAECLVFAARAAEAIGDTKTAPQQGEAGAAPAGAIAAPAGIDGIAALLWEHVGLERERAGLTRACAAIDALERAPRRMERAALEARSALAVARTIARAALLREESRGSHYRVDFPERDDAHWRRRIVWSASGQVYEPLTAERTAP